MTSFGDPTIFTVLRRYLAAWRWRRAQARQLRQRSSRVKTPDLRK